MKYSCDFLIVGGGVVGLTIAHQILERKISNKVIILDKEVDLGLHSSGRNSVLNMLEYIMNPIQLRLKFVCRGKTSKRMVN